VLNNFDKTSHTILWIFIQQFLSCYMQKKWTDRHGENNRCIFATLLWMHLKWKIRLTGEYLFFADINFDITLYLDIIALLFSFKYTQCKSILQCTLNYLGVDYSVCGLSVHECFFNLPSIWLIQLRTMKKNIWLIKADTGQCDSSSGACASTQRVGSVWEEHVFQPVSS
jgi:hypothetical protein